MWSVGVVAAAVVILGFWIWLKGRPFASGDVFRASRLSSGNRLFPTQVQITPTAIVHHTPHWFGPACRRLRCCAGPVRAVG
jgi:hypothetical protein